MDTVSVAFDPGEICGVVLPVHEVAAVVVGFVHSLKSCGIWPPFVTLNVTEPCATVFVDSLKPNSEGFPAVTVTVAAARVDFAAATGTTTTSTRAAAASSSVRTCFMRLLDLGRAHREAAPGFTPSVSHGLSHLVGEPVWSIVEAGRVPVGNAAPRPVLRPLDQPVLQAPPVEVVRRHLIVRNLDPDEVHRRRGGPGKLVPFLCNDRHGLDLVEQKPRQVVDLRGRRRASCEHAEVDAHLERGRLRPRDAECQPRLRHQAPCGCQRKPRTAPTTPIAPHNSTTPIAPASLQKCSL